MLTGAALGKAIRAALEAKRKASGHSFAQMARHVFQVQPESMQGWMRTGAISKPNFEKLRRYVADVVPDTHWGSAVAPLAPAPGISAEQRALLAALLDVASRTNSVGLRHLLVDAEHYAQRYPLGAVEKKPGRAA